LEKKLGEGGTFKSGGEISRRQLIWKLRRNHCPKNVEGSSDWRDHGHSKRYLQEYSESSKGEISSLGGGEGA